MAQAPFDEAMMRRALFHAARGAGRTTPNPMVGAVVVSADGIVVGHGWHEQAGGPHAEIHALEAAGAAARGGTLYVTLEPCCHVGRTGPCTRAIIDAGAAHVIAAMQDTDPRVSGRGFAELRAHGVTVTEGLLGTEARRLNAAFIMATEHRRPLVVLKAATSLDGRVAASCGVRTALTSAAANRRTQLLRASLDGIAVGVQTMLVDDPLLTVRECARIRPLVRVIFDRQLRTPPTARIFSTLSDGPVIMLSAPGSAATAGHAAALEAVGATILETPTLADAMHALVRLDVQTLLVEGGPTLQASFCAAQMVDRVHLIVAPRVLGVNAPPWLDATVLPWSALSLVRAEPRGPDTWIEADVYRDR